MHINISCVLVHRVVSKEDKYEAARNETVLAIAAWVKEHPRATQVRSLVGPPQLCQVTILSGTDTGGGDATDRTVQTENRKNIKKRETFMFTIFM